LTSTPRCTFIPALASSGTVHTQLAARLTAFRITIVADLKLRKLATYSDVGSAQILCVDDGRVAVSLDHHQRRLFVCAEGGTTRLHELGPLSRAFTGRDFDEAQRGALFAYRDGFGAVFDDQVLLFDTTTSAPRMLPVSNPVHGPILAGVPLPALPRHAMYEPAADRLCVLFGERQAHGQLTFLGSLRFGADSATYDATPEPLVPPPDDERFVAKADFYTAQNSMQLVAPAILDDRLVVATYGRRTDVSFGKSPKKLYVLSLDAALQATGVLAELDASHTIGAFRADGAVLGLANREGNGKKTNEIVFHDVATGRRARVNLRGNRTDYTPLRTENRGVFAWQGERLWLSVDGFPTSTVNAYVVEAAPFSL
jgi:hypothetical protein